VNNTSKKFTVLVVDDEQKICDLIQLFLSLSPMIGKIVTANNALQALQKMENQEFDLVIADQMMPGKSGLEFLGNLSKSLKYGNMKLLLISGCLSKDDVQQAVRSNIKNILIKPFTREKLLEKIFQLLDISPPNKS